VDKKFILKAELTIQKPGFLDRLSDRFTQRFQSVSHPQHNIIQNTP